MIIVPILIAVKIFKVELPELKGIKVFPVDDKEAQDKRTEFLARWQALQAN